MSGGLKQLVEATYLQAGLGIRVNRAPAADAVGPTNIFTIAGGLVLVTSLVAVVTTLRAGALATTLFSHSTGPTALCLATNTIASPVGTTITLSGDFGEQLIVGVGTGVANTFPPIQGGMKGSGAGEQMFGVIMGVGTITTTISVVTAGATRYRLSYIPIDEGATVAAA